MLRPDEREEAAHFGEKAAQVLHEGIFQIPLGMSIGEAEEMESIVIIHGQGSQELNLWGQCLVEVSLVEEVFSVALIFNLVLVNSLQLVNA